MNTITLKNWLRLCGTLGLLASFGGCNAMFLDAEVDTDTTGGDADTDTDSDTDSDTDVDTDSDTDTDTDTDIPPLEYCDSWTSDCTSCLECSWSNLGACTDYYATCFDDPTSACAQLAGCIANDCTVSSGGGGPDIGIDPDCIANCELLHSDGVLAYQDFQWCMLCLDCSTLCTETPEYIDVCEATPECDTLLDCAECAACAIGIDQACEPDYNNCLGDPDCPEYLNCVTTCTDVESCDACNIYATFTAIDLYNTLQTCFTCTGCPTTCAGGYGWESCGATSLCDVGGTCADCLSCVDANALCQAQITTCDNEPDCVDLISCLDQCALDFANDATFDLAACEGGCMDAHLTGADLFNALNQCQYCDNCSNDCAAETPVPCAIPL